MNLKDLKLNNNFIKKKDCYYSVSSLNKLLQCYFIL